LLRPLAIHFQFVKVGRIHNRRVTVALNLCLRELQAHQLSSALREFCRALQNSRSVSELTPAGFDRQRFWRDQFLQGGAITREISSPYSFASIEQSLLPLLRQSSWRLILLRDGFGVKFRIAAGLYPLAILLRVEVSDAESPLRWTVRRIRLDFSSEAYKSRITFEDHVEFAHLVAFHAVRT